MPTRRSLALLSTLLASTSLAATYTDSKYGFSLTYPAGWQARANVGPAAAALLAPPVNGFSTNVNVVVQTVPAGTSLDSVYTQTVTSLPKLITDFKKVSNRATTVGGQPAQELVYTGRQGQFSLRFKQRFALSGGKLYVLTATSQQADATADAKLSPLLDSFKLGK